MNRNGSQAFLQTPQTSIQINGSTSGGLDFCLDFCRPKNMASENIVSKSEHCQSIGKKFRYLFNLVLKYDN